VGVQARGAQVVPPVSGAACGLVEHRQGHWVLSYRTSKKPSFRGDIDGRRGIQSRQFRRLDLGTEAKTWGGDNPEDAIACDEPLGARLICVTKQKQTQYVKKIIKCENLSLNIEKYWRCERGEAGKLHKPSTCSIVLVLRGCWL